MFICVFFFVFLARFARFLRVSCAFCAFLRFLRVSCAFLRNAENADKKPMDLRILLGEISRRIRRIRSRRRYFSPRGRNLPSRYPNGGSFQTIMTRAKLGVAGHWSDAKYAVIGIRLFK